MASWSDVRRIVLALPRTSETVSSAGKRTWVVAAKAFAWERPLRKSDLAALGTGAPAGPILGLHTADLEMKEALIASDPLVFFTTPHFNGYPAVLVCLDRAPRATLRVAVVESWLTRAPKAVAAEFLATTRRRPPRA